MKTVIARAGVFGALAALAVTAGCSSSSSGTDGSSAPTSAALPVATVVQQLALTAKEIPAGLKWGLIPGGNQVKGQVTLDNCGYHYTSEAYRVARRQYGAQKKQGGGYYALSNEVVAYDTTAHATLALNEVRRAAATCPKGSFTTNLASTPTLTEHIFTNQSPARGVPSRASVLLTMVVSAQGQSQYGIELFQMHGRYLDAVYAKTSAKSNAKNLATVVRLATVTGKRLMAAS